VNVLEQLRERDEAWLDSGLTYDGITPVQVHVTKRERKFLFSDDGAAVAAAGVWPASVDFGDRIQEGRYEANVSRRGVVFVPAVEHAGPEWLARVATVVAEASRDLYSALLELDEG
jgi:hypothetical protein